jgi:RimJ/RimL family protein N-acetyltransferase
MIPTLETARLRLRPPRLADFEAWAAYYASPRSGHEGGPFDRVEAWKLFAADVGLWQLRGYGAFGVDDSTSGRHLGEVGIYQRADYPGPELGWMVVPEAEGRGIAAEAARAVLRWIRQSFGWRFVTSIISPGNARSIALGLRLGGVVDPTLPGIDADDVVIRHDLCPGGPVPGLDARPA